MSRKYKQRGYMESDNEQNRAPQRKMAEQFRKGPVRRTVRVLKCSRCGATVRNSETIRYDRTCEKCGSDLRSCVNCGSFDPSSRFQCMREIKKNIAPKDKRNNCPEFNIKKSVEKTFAEPEETQRDARQAFEDLFRNL